MLAIDVRGVHKSFRIPHERRTTLTERLMGLLRPVHYECFEVLRGVDLAVPRGCFMGIVGSNGSGKSTLLKIIAGLLVADAGTVCVNGSVSALLELGLGFHPELTVEENVELYGTLLGYPRNDLRARVDAAITFAEIERFRDAKLKNLSTGMQMRLAFATALQAASEIMLLDEVLAVGDAAFQRKCLEVFAELKQRGTTVLLVSHNLEHVRRFCDHALLLEAGHVVLCDQPSAVIARYLSRSEARVRVGSAQSSGLGNGTIHLREAWLEDTTGKRADSIASGERPTLVFIVETAADTANPVYGAIIRDWRGAIVYSANTLGLATPAGDLHAGDILELRFPFFAALRNGHYSVDVAVTDSTGSIIYDWVHGLTQFLITGSACQDGEVDLRGEFSWRLLDRGAAVNARLRAANARSR